MTTMRRRLGIALLALTVAVGLSACGRGGGGTSKAPPARRSSVVTSSAGATDAPTARRPAQPPGATVARAATDLDVFASPGATMPTRILPAKTSFGTARALLVMSAAGEWLQVLLPVRPNGSTGWIRRTDVAIRQVTTRIDVDLASRTLTLRDGDTVVIQTPVAVGAPDVPTPTGTFSVVDKLATGDDAGAYGPFALGLSGHSDVLTEFGGGDGQVGIHGTNDPSSIGRAVSHGCVRVPNDVAVELNAIVALGTPVTIK
ncbi:MAG TPA: L,D-transpeptidase family protein [Acidimicrobiales bacterium]|jgi:lipoprotein-anchoring transpeptidase ErfK/SrfK|nr:L,D-transpeptidase family protein [Acidimicrobiales bacterium]